MKLKVGKLVTLDYTYDLDYNENEITEQGTVIGLVKCSLLHKQIGEIYSVASDGNIAFVWVPGIQKFARIHADYMRDLNELVTT